MGTVPDPLISARLSLVATPEEKNGLREPQSPKHLCKQASAESNSNGFPLTAKAQPAGDHLLNTSCATVADESRDEQRHGHDANQPSMFSPGSFSPSKDGHLAILQPASTSEQEGSSVSRGLAVVEGFTPVQMAVKSLATQEANETVQSSDREQFCRAIDKADSTPGDSVEGSKAVQGCISPSLQSVAHQASPAAKETVGEKTGPERPHLLVKESAVPDLRVKSPVCSGAKPTDREDASPHPSTEAVPGKVLQPHLESPAQPSCKTETEEKVAAELSKFKDTGTMTMQTGPRSVVHRDHQDAEVQAVVSVESKSASTSPTILAAFLRESMPPGTKQYPEQPCIIYTGAGGKEPSEIVGGFAPLLQMAPPMGIMPEVCTQAADASGTQGVRLQSDLIGMHDIVSSALSDNGKHPCSLTYSSTQDASVSRIEAQKAAEASNRGGASRQPSDVSVLLKTRPVYQITVNSNNPPVAPLQPVNVETKLPPSVVFSEFDSRHQDPRPCVAGNSQASPSCHQLSRQAICTVVDTHDSKRGPHLQIQSVGDPGTSASSSHMDVKPKREEKLVPLCPKEQEMSKVGVTAGPQIRCSPGVGKREQHKLPEHNQETKLSGGQGLTAGPESESRRSPIPGRGLRVAKGSDVTKEAKLEKTVAPAQHRLNLSGNKKESRPATEAKGQLKQSKRVRDVVWDEQGMTWEVYGASLDPESLGIAIQNHLQRQIREHEKLIKAQATQNRKSISSDTSSNKKRKGRQHGVFQSMLQNFRRPNCCVRPTASSVSD